MGNESEDSKAQEAANAAATENLVSRVTPVPEKPAEAGQKNRGAEQVLGDKYEPSGYTPSRWISADDGHGDSYVRVASPYRSRNGDEVRYISADPVRVVRSPTVVVERPRSARGLFESAPVAVARPRSFRAVPQTVVIERQPEVVESRRSGRQIIMERQRAFFEEPGSVQARPRSATSPFRERTVVVSQPRAERIVYERRAASPPRQVVYATQQTPSSRIIHQAPQTVYVQPRHEERVVRVVQPQEERVVIERPRVVQPRVVYERPRVVQPRQEERVVYEQPRQRTETYEPPREHRVIYEQPRTERVIYEPRSTPVRVAQQPQRIVYEQPSERVVYHSPREVVSARPRVVYQQADLSSSRQGSGRQY